MDELYDEKAAARILSVAPRTLRRWRAQGKVSPYRTLGGRIRYSLDQLLEMRKRLAAPDELNDAA